MTQDLSAGASLTDDTSSTDDRSVHQTPVAERFRAAASADGTAAGEVRKGVWPRSRVDGRRRRSAHPDAAACSLFRGCGISWGRFGPGRPYDASANMGCADRRSRPQSCRGLRLNGSFREPDRSGGETERRGIRRNDVPPERAARMSSRATANKELAPTRSAPDCRLSLPMPSRQSRPRLDPAGKSRRRKPRPSAGATTGRFVLSARISIHHKRRIDAMALTAAMVQLLREAPARESLRRSPACRSSLDVNGFSTSP